MTDDNFEKERPTSPDLQRFACPCCFGKGRVPLKEGGRKPCEVCWGVGEIDREQMEKWKLKNG